MGYSPSAQARLMRRHAAAWEMLRNGTDPETVRSRLGYPSLSAVTQGTNRYRRTLSGQDREYNVGTVLVQARPDAGSRVVLSRRPLDRAGWSPGDQIAWHVHEGFVLLFREEAMRCEPDPGDRESLAYCLVRVDGMEVGAAAERLGVSRSGLHRMVQRYAKRRPWLRVTLQPRTGQPVSGVVRVTTRSGQPTLLLTTPVTRQGWITGETIGWRFFPDSRGLRLERVATPEKN